MAEVSKPVSGDERLRRSFLDEEALGVRRSLQLRLLALPVIAIWIAIEIGGDQRLEFAVLGDTVNVASRIEAATRDLGVDYLVSEETIEAARREGCSEDLVARLRPRQSENLRGRSGETRLWELA